VSNSRKAPERPQSDLLRCALWYHGRGCSIVPMAMATKKPARPWKAYQTHRASEAQLRAWFKPGTDYGIAVIFGEVSGRLASRDFDDLDAYQLWANAHRDLARILPTVATRRGRHVYCIAAPGSLDAVRRQLGKPGNGAISFTDGELRADVGCYSVLPPSLHPSGHVYRWEIPPAKQIPIVDLQAAGFLGELKGATADVQQRALMQLKPSGSESDDQHTFSHSLHTYSQSSKSSQCSTFSLLHENAPSLLQKGEPTANSTIDASLADKIDQAIQRTLPDNPGERHKRLFDFARELKAIPELNGAPLDKLRCYVRQWHKSALPRITTKVFDDTWFEFCEAWQRAKYPAGQEPIIAAFARAKASEPPEAAAEFERPELRLFVTFCRELQRTAGDAPFFLDARTAGKLLGTDHTTAWRWLRGLCANGLLRLESSGSREKHQANRYRYVAPL
jgi:hypothetical protein